LLRRRRRAEPPEHGVYAAAGTNGGLSLLRLDLDYLERLLGALPQPLLVQLADEGGLT